MTGGGEGSGKAAPAAELVDSAYRWEVDDAAVLYRGLGLADMAHVLLAAEAGLIPGPDARALLIALREIQAIAPENAGLDPARGDVYSNREHMLAARIGDAAGWLRIGRARRDATNLAFQIAGRDRVLALIEALTDLAEALIEAAARHVGTIMPDYTYLQPAQPTTLAHYLLSFVFPIRRDFDRLQAGFRRLNECSGGIGSVNGSGLPLDRLRLAGLLGFEGVVTHTRDAMWRADVPVELLAAAAAVSINIDRLAEDLQIWVTREFDLAELDDGHARGSVIMPQKKNPYSLAFARGAAGVLIGRLTAAAAAGRGPTGQPDSRLFVYGELPRAFDLAIRTTRLAAGVVAKMTFHEATMAARAEQGFAQATDLAELVMRASGLPAQSAHRLIREVVTAAECEGIPAARLSSRRIDEAAARLGMARPGLPEDAVAAVLDPRRIVASRVGLGGAAPAPVQEMIASARTAVVEARRWASDRRRRIAAAEDALLSAVIARTSAPEARS